jgi:hypothetical protein
MIQPITLLGAGLCFAVLFLRYRSQPKNRPPRSRQQKLKTAKVLLAALLAWMTLIFTLHHMIDKIDGADREPSLMERMVAFLSK